MRYHPVPNASASKPIPILYFQITAMDIQQQALDLFFSFFFLASNRLTLKKQKNNRQVTPISMHPTHLDVQRDSLSISMDPPLFSYGRTGSRQVLTPIIMSTQSTLKNKTKIKQMLKYLRSRNGALFMIHSDDRMRGVRLFFTVCAASSKNCDIIYVDIVLMSSSNGWYRQQSMTTVGTREREREKSRWLLDC